MNPEPHRRGGEETAGQNPFRALPSIDEALRQLEGHECASGIPRSVLAGLVADEVEAFRRRIAADKLDAGAVQRELAGGAFLGEVLQHLRRAVVGLGETAERDSLMRCWNLPVMSLTCSTGWETCFVSKMTITGLERHGRFIHGSNSKFERTGHGMNGFMT